MLPGRECSAAAAMLAFSTDTECARSPLNPYDRYLLPRLTNWVCGSPLIERQRSQVVPRARGRVLEIGFGSGLNLPHYARHAVEWIWAVEPSEPMRRLASARVVASGLDVRMLDARAEEVALPEACADSAVVTFSLCTIPDPAAALAQVRRLLKPGGRLLLAEHGAAPDVATRRWQDRLNGIWGCFAGGCNLNRDIAALVQAAGFEFEELQQRYLPHTPHFVGYVTWGEARATRPPDPAEARSA